MAQTTARILGSGRSTHRHILTYSRLVRENVLHICILSTGDLNICIHGIQPSAGRKEGRGVGVGGGVETRNLYQYGQWLPNSCEDSEFR